MLRSIDERLDVYEGAYAEPPDASVEVYELATIADEDVKGS